MKPEIRKLDDGDTVVDYGLTWYRVRQDGTITKKIAKVEGVDQRPATNAEARKIQKLLSSAVRG